MYLLHLDLDSGPPPATFTALRTAGAVVIDIGQPATEIAGLDLDITWDGAPDRAIEDLVRHLVAVDVPTPVARLVVASLTADAA